MPIAARATICIVLCLAVVTAACGGHLLKPKYEYEEELYLDLDGSATLNVNASVPALVALRGADLPTDPRARLDREKVRALFGDRAADVTLSLSRRDGRRFVHVSVDVDNVRDLASLPLTSWSTYRVERNAERITYQQTVGPSSQRPVDRVDWDGTERIAFRMHVPSEVLFQNTATGVQRGNILEWEQLLTARASGEPLELRMQMAPESILYTTLLLFGSTILVAAGAFAAVLWWFFRRGRPTGVAESRV